MVKKMISPSNDYKKCINYGVCANVCKSSAIFYQKNNEGFYYAKIDKNKCINCLQCQKKCIANSDLESNQIDSMRAYAGKYKFKNDRIKSTSGGFCDALSKYVIENNGCVFGVAYSEDFKSTKYICVNDFKDLAKIRGVKYCQSSNPNIALLEKELKNNNLVLVIGLPCVITALSNAFSEKYPNLLLVALACHGPTSTKVHNKFLNKYTKDFNNIQLRKKYNGKDYFYLSNDNNIIEKELWENTSYFDAFNILNNESCYSCKYKLDSIKADILVGDYWGLEDDKEFFSIDGNNAIIFLNDRINEFELFNNLRNFEYKSKTINDIVSRNKSIIFKNQKSPYYDNFIKYLDECRNLDEAIKKTIPFKTRMKKTIKMLIMKILPIYVITSVRQRRK